MGTKRHRRPHRLTMRPLRPEVAHFLETGDPVPALRLNPFFTFAVQTREGRAAYEAWQRGDREQAIALLAAQPAARRNIFV